MEDEQSRIRKAEGTTAEGAAVVPRSVGDARTTRGAAAAEVPACGDLMLASATCIA